MIRKKLAFIIACILIMTSLSGCAQMITLTDDEEEQIAIYISSLIGKYNRNQQKGLSYVSKNRQKELMEEEMAEQGISDTPYEGDMDGEDPESGGVAAGEDSLMSPDIDPSLLEGEALTEDGTANSEGDSPEGDDSGRVSAGSSGSSNISDIVSVEGGSLSYDGAKVTNHYGTDYYDLSPTRGYEFLELSFTLKNTTDSELSVDTGKLGLVFRATVDGVTAKSDQTILINDLKSYVGEIPAGESVDLVLLFQYPSGRIESLDDLSVEAEYGGNTYQVIL